MANFDSTEKDEVMISRKHWKKFQIFETLFGYGTLFIATPIVTFILVKLSVAIQNVYLITKHSNEVYLLTPGWPEFLVGFFMGLLLCFWIGQFIFKPWARRFVSNEDEWRVFYLKRYEKGGKPMSIKIGSIFAIFIVPLFLVSTILGIDNYTKITDHSLIYNGYFTFKEREYSFTNILKIFYTESFQNKQTKEIKSAPSSYVVLFKDGFTWETLNYHDIHNTPKEKEIIGYISERANIPIVTAVENIDFTK